MKHRTAALLVVAMAVASLGIGAFLAHTSAASRCARGKVAYQVLNDCTMLNNCTFTPTDLANVRDLTMYCRRGE